MPDREDIRYEAHDPFDEIKENPQGKFKHPLVRDKLVLIAHQGAGDYYAFLSDTSGNYLKVLTASERQPFRCREYALIAALVEFRDLPFFHTNGEWPPDLKTNVLKNLELVAQHGVGSALVNKQTLSYGVNKGFISHSAISDAQRKYKSSQR